MLALVLLVIKAVVVVELLDQELKVLQFVQVEMVVAVQQVQ